MDLEKEWTMDSSCSFHMTPNKSWFKELKQEETGMVLLGNNKPCKVLRVVSIRIRIWDGMERLMQNVRYVPELKRNLVSLGMLDEQGYVFKVERGVLKVLKDSRVVMKSCKKKGLYSIQGKTIVGIATRASGNGLNRIVLWHQRLGHLSEKGLNELGKQGLLCGHKVDSLDFCEYCLYGKACKVKFETGQQRTKGTLDYIHSNLWEPLRIPSH